MSYERELVTGYYWVRLSYECDSPEEIAYWCVTAGIWVTFGGHYVPMRDVEVLDEQPITRSEARRHDQP